jgi:cellulose synthase/poly-beta-1,6-N-acetylglucosamine synthase-like glycosyltransferase
MFEFFMMACLILFTGYYAYFLIRVQIGLSKLGAQSKQALQPFVSVVVAARNEEKNIADLLSTLLRQSYPSEKYEIIIVDDASTDRTSGIVLQFQAQQKSIVLLHAIASSQKTAGRKAAALTQAIQNAKGEIIITTDADCTVPHRWIETLAQYFSEETAMVAGPVAEKTSASVLGNLEALEFLGLITVGAGLIGSGRPIICNGANLAYRKSAFERVHGFGRGTNDDESLMNRMAYQHAGTITFAATPEALVTTASDNTLKTFLHQRTRWANKRGQYEDASILFSLVTLYLFFVSIAAVWILAIFNSGWILPALLALSAKIILDFSTLRAGAKRWNQHISMPYFLVAEAFHVPYILMAAAIGQFSTLTWKGNKIA